jgi:DNA polymerase III epsilon subunit-like protein
MSYAVLDTETVLQPGARQVRGEHSLVYDLSYIIYDNRTNEPLVRRSSVICEVFCNTSLMASAFYGQKRDSFYKPAMRAGKIAHLHFADVRAQFIHDCEQFGVREVYAYNIKFDLAALKNTCEIISNNIQAEFFSPNLKFVDIWDYAGAKITSTKKYVKWCVDNCYFSNSCKNPSTSAETVARYLDILAPDECEQHTALADCELEHAILLACKKRHSKKPKTYGNGWRAASKNYKQLK